jgi:crotonobetainyl-CoA:carnitine CoA-transferase CaiB-like acyl-CoA transferase
MVETADVLVENFRPSVPARLGIDYPRLKPINPRLVYCDLSGYGDSGPLSEKGGFDQVLQYLSDIAVFQGAAAGTPQVVLGSVLIISSRRCSPMASPQRCTVASTAAKGNI